ncbi:tRNA-binding protein [Candidatus Neomarinimicrobiota bacterium]
MESQITIKDLSRLEIRVGTVLEIQPAKNVRNPAYQLTIDFGELGKKTSSAQITDHYTIADLVDRQVIAIINFPPKKIGVFESQVLVLGAYESSGTVRLLQPDQSIANGARLR